MSYQPYSPQPPFAPAPPPKRSLSTGAVIAIVVGSLLAICCIGSVVLVAVSPDNTTNTTTVAADASRAAAAPSVAPSSESSADPEPTLAAPKPTKPSKIKVPNLTGQNAQIAQDKLEKLGFTNVQLGSVDEGDTMVILAANWTVVKQEPKAGSMLDPDDTIVLSCSKQVN